MSFNWRNRTLKNTLLVWREGARVKVSVYKLIVFMFAAIMLLPDYFSSSLLNALENVLLIGTGCILLKYRHKKNQELFENLHEVVI